MTDLIERLRAVEGGDDGTHWYRNPDGPEAAARIAELEEMVNSDEARAQDLAIRIAELEVEVARLKAERNVARHIYGSFVAPRR